MFTRQLNIFLFLGIIFSIIFAGCPSPDSDPEPEPTQVPVGGRPIGDVYMSIIENKIYNISAGMEYSLNNKGSWTSCAGCIESVTFSIGDMVWVRETGDSATEFFLGEVNALSGYPDLVASNAIYIMKNNAPYYDDYATGIPDDNMEIWFDFYNIGDTSGYSPDHQIKFYLSLDKEITSSDELLYDYNYNYSCPKGLVYGDSLVFTVPAVIAGTYYIGCIIDATNKIQELNDGNNATLPSDVAEILIAETAVSPAGAFKVINSWGTSGDWENVPDGHYWVTYNTMKHQQIGIWYYYNTFTHVYKPTVIAVFALTHPRREECKIIFGLGNPSDPYVKKEFQMRWNDDIKGGPKPFPANNMALDISEFAQFINDFDLFLCVENLGEDDGTVDYFAVEFYDDYDSVPFKTLKLSGVPLSVPASDTENFFISTKGALNDAQLLNIKPLSRSDINGNIFIEEKPDEAELEKDMKRSGIFKEGKNYNYVNSEGLGTGLIPPTEEQWRNVNKLKGLRSDRSRAAMPNTLDYSLTQYFPPVGNQRTEGTCVCFSFGYYIGTFMEALEHGWDLSLATWSGSSPGAPDISYQDMILSPDFIYHQINNGVDEGSSYAIAATFMVNTGCCSWQSMPYDVYDSTTWPGETAYREAPRYRGAKTGNHYFDFLQSGYFIIRTDEDINLLKQLLNAGYCVSMAVDGSDNGWWFYNLLSGQDVIDDTEAALMDTDHAQTVVGYKEGDGVWDPLTPDS